MRIVHDNSISKSDCDFIIQEYERRGPSDRWCNSDHLTFRPKNFSENQRMLDILNKIASVTGYDIDWGEIVKRPPGTEHPKHLDIAEESTIFSSVTYLNDNFTGGETYIINDITLRKHVRDLSVKISPKTGRTLYFDGKQYEHGVTEVKDSHRYTLAIWYKEHESV